MGREPRARLEVDVRPQYPNMRSYLEPFPEIVEAAERAIRAEGIEPVRTPIRGGTDGSLLSAMGLPTPNLFTGGHEYHSCASGRRCRRWRRRRRRSCISPASGRGGARRAGHIRPDAGV